MYHNDIWGPLVSHTIGKNLRCLIRHRRRSSIPHRQAAARRPAGWSCRRGSRSSIRTAGCSDVGREGRRWRRMRGRARFRVGGGGARFRVGGGGARAGRRGALTRAAAGEVQARLVSVANSGGEAGRVRGGAGRQGAPTKPGEAELDSAPEAELRAWRRVGAGVGCAAELARGLHGRCGGRRRRRRGRRRERKFPARGSWPLPLLFLGYSKWL